MSNSIAVPNHPSAQRCRVLWRALPVLGSNWTAVAFFQDVWRLAQPYWASEEKWYARGMLAILLSIKLAAIYICVQQNEWYNSFHSALQTNDIQAFFKQIGIFGKAGRVPIRISRLWKTSACLPGRRSIS
jgi:ABC-type uncharacterized transport system fused permease/ATPase subunit